MEPYSEPRTRALTFARPSENSQTSNRPQITEETPSNTLAKFLLKYIGYLYNYYSNNLQNTTNYILHLV